MCLTSIFFPYVPNSSNSTTWQSTYQALRDAHWNNLFNYLALYFSVFVQL
jgi:hypothetical protein